MTQKQNITFSGNTVQDWETTLTVSTESVFTSSSTDEIELPVNIRLTGPAKNSLELYIATGGIISPNVYYHFVR
jgi:hypothetical protein